MTGRRAVACGRWISTCPRTRRASRTASVAWRPDKVKPRAREIDKSGEYPTDLFEAFRDAGLLGLCIPESLGGSGAGILGLTLAIEEVAKYSNTAALMLLLTRLPTGPVLIAGTEEQKRRYLPGHRRRGRCGPPSGCPSPRPAATSWGCGPGPCPTPTATAAGC